MTADATLDLLLAHGVISIVRASRALNISELRGDHAGDAAVDN